MSEVVNKLMDKMTDKKAKLEEKVEAINEILKQGTMTQYISARNILQMDIDAGNSETIRIIYNNCAKAENPIREIITLFEYPYTRIVEKKNKDTDAIESVSLDTKKNRMIDLYDFCKKQRLNQEWVNKCDLLLTLFQVKISDAMKMSDAQLANESILFNRIVKDKKDGKTPDSNTQLTKLLQEICNDCNVPAKITNHDILFINLCITNLDKKVKCGVKVISPAKFREIITRVMYQHISECGYAVVMRKIELNK